MWRFKHYGEMPFFKGQGLVNYLAMSQNGLALLLIEKGRALKTVDRIEEANTVFKSATDILQENVAAVRMRYGYFRGVGQAFRNIALARQEQEDYEGALNALEQSAYFYSMVKPTPPETDLFEVFYRQAKGYRTCPKPLLFQHINSAKPRMFLQSRIRFQPTSNIIMYAKVFIFESKFRNKRQLSLENNDVVFTEFLNRLSAFVLIIPFLY